MNIHISDLLQLEVKDDAIILKKKIVHKTFEERLAEYNGEISIFDFDWGNPMGKEI